MNEQFDENNRINLLLVEDDEDACGALVTRLKKRFCDVTSADTAEKGLDILKNNEFDVIVSDIKLPNMDGIEFLRHVREIKDGIPVILLTGYASLDSAKEAVKLNAYDYLMKPLDNIDQLMSPVRKAAQSYRLICENRKLNAELQEKLKELQRWQKLTIGRELNMIDLKKEINGLLQELGRPEKYNPVQNENINN